MASNRIGRINEEIQRELAQQLRLLKDPRVQKTMVSITHVETTPDLRYAKVYVSLLDRSCTKEVLAGLKSSGGFLRRALGKSRSCATRRSCSGRRTIPSSTARTFSTFSPSSTSRRTRKMKQLTIREAADFLLRNDNYVLLTHRRPDGDTIGSAAALCAGLRSLGKTAHVLENPQFTEKFRPWLGKLTCETLPSSACVVSVDIAAENLLPFDLPDCAIELQIDHHAGNRQFGLQAFVDASAAACGEIILRLLQLMGVKLDASMGAALYVAISTDTGCFRFNNTTADTLRCAAACKDTGADTFAINTALFMTKRLPRLQLEARLTEKMEFYAGGAVAVNTLPNVLLVELGLTEDDVDDISGFSREIAGVEIGVMLREGPEGGKISLRCSPKYDAAAICARLGGGGHRGAAGASVPEGLDAAKKAILQAIADSGVEL